jgi:hypothetical protein
VICPPDVLCKWIKEENRWETLEELALELERESLNTVDGQPMVKKIGRPKLVLPRPKYARAPSEIEKARAAMKRKQYLQACKLTANHRIERMMSLACPKRRRNMA